MIWRISDRLMSVLSFLGMVGILAMMLHICVDIIARSLFGVSVPATLEMVTRYYMLMIALLPLAWVENNRAMITVEAFSGLFGHLGLRVVDTVVTLVCSAIYLVLAVSTWDKAVEQFEIGAYVIALDTRIMVWPGYFMLPAGFSLAALVCLTRLFEPVSSESEADVE